MTNHETSTSFERILIVSIIGLHIASRLLGPHDVFTWWLEVSPTLIALPLLIATAERIRFTRFVYTFIWIHMIILLIGGHYTYAEVPLFNWIKDTFSLARNNYDRVGHFMQGFVPALIIREYLIRFSPLNKGKLLSVLTIASCLAISALYELFEGIVSFIVGVSTGDRVDAFLGTQGDIWDTQWDMACALTGATCAVIFLGKMHERYIDASKK